MSVRLFGAFGSSLLVACAAPVPTQTSPSSSPATKAAEPTQAPVAPPHLTDSNALTAAKPTVDDAFQYNAEFFPGSTYDAKIATPDSVLGSPVGTRPAHHAEVAQLWRTWASQSPRVKLEVTGKTYEGRELFANVVTSQKNMARLDEIRAKIAKLADPRTLAPGEEGSIVKDTPAIAWLGYSIHGDEMSGSDGGLALAYHLIAGTNEETTKLLDELVIVFDPMLNPDGRERFLSMTAQTSGLVPNLDSDSLHRGHWPWGRGNHYLFDMNRDWMSGLAPETRARWSALVKWHPQLLVDAHEMGGYDTFLFYPANEPINRNVPSTTQKWWTIFAADDAKAFDQYGWSYYTREWADYWYPGYSDEWATLSGAVGILYEQARFGGQPMRRQAGDIGTHREAAHHQAVSSLSNLKTLAAHREEMLRDYLATKRESCDAAKHARDLVLVTGKNPTRESFLIDGLIAQGIDVRRASDALSAKSLVALDGSSIDAKELPKGSLVIPAAQPMGGLVRAYLEFDPRYTKEQLVEERKEIERKGTSKIYDVTAWNLVRALDLEGYWCDLASVPSERIGASDAPKGFVATHSSGAPYGWIVDGRDDASVKFAALALEVGLKVSFADKDFTNGGFKFSRGSLLIRDIENSEIKGFSWPLGERFDSALLDELAAKSGASVHVATTGRSPDDGPDLGSNHFHLLARPRIAVVANSPASPDGFGHVWELLDRELGVPSTMLDAQELGQYDLRRYNVIILPPGIGRDSIDSIKDALQAWVRSGGTLIAMDSAAVALADEKLGFSGVRRREDVLEKLAEWQFAAKREAAARSIAIDEADLWNPKAKPKKDDAKSDDKSGEKKDDKKDASKSDDDASAKLVDPDKTRQEEWMKLFAPQGVMLRGLVNTDEWITAGAGEELPVFFQGAQVLLSRSPVHTAIRFATADKLRIEGLLWPEARERLEGSAYLTVEHIGHGQLILFAAEPGFRGFHKATGRLLENAVVYGPGVGADQPIGW